ncbi:MAG: single-stranded DNA-binding protein [Actinomycetales bacterium]|uniref:Single-stranded DNA-binding protein n=1 Tax=Candidatus Phosphoribacter hodrii TaxID=2953743 RepID=A0A934X7V0_9MICO|nr:single-stranded DNA-binding protein [Candidatus Phosphoribacter hodrii]OPZ54757.1 MAG: Single-stranded DNA-binding protein 1 [bacterium ADurb.BinA028]HNV14319.1 single-stranded DNA-binding protein [Dermatophilaceae bacterium]MBK7273951.1 single-stranded DNA-binding protein [Candidatus Phosphoribacter hodrii]MBL0004270.1 single-stranded DNA-binding protein [Candidatus Phosphoribacter hodrii]
MPSPFAMDGAAYPLQVEDTHMYESYVTVVGNLTADPVLRTTKAGKPFATFRMASTPRRWDGRERAYVDGGTNFVSVVTFNSLAANVVASMAKGQPVIVYGRLRVNMWSTAEGHSNTSVEIDAYHVGHDLMWGQSLFTKSPRAQFDTTDRLSEPEIQQALAEDVDGPSDIEDEDREPDWSPINIDFTADAADPVVIEGAPLTGASSWSGANPETDAYVVAHAR